MTLLESCDAHLPLEVASTHWSYPFLKRQSHIVAASFITCINRVIFAVVVCQSSVQKLTVILFFQSINKLAYSIHTFITPNISAIMLLKRRVSARSRLKAIHQVRSHLLLGVLFTGRCTALTSKTHFVAALTPSLQPFTP